MAVFFLETPDMTHRPIQQLFDLTGKTALVTGGSRGLGLQMAFALGEAGAKIMLSSRKASDLEEAATELQAKGIDARWIAADCALETDIHRLADETLERMGDVDILVNNAGAAWGAPAEDESQCARLLFAQPAHCKKIDDCEKRYRRGFTWRLDHQHRFHRRPWRQPQRHEYHCLQHFQRRSH
jgi:NAD(P)-dependent dehydrogenase (short-subunit alcohol dehydrogenase family)